MGYARRVNEVGVVIYELDGLEIDVDVPGGVLWLPLYRVRGHSMYRVRGSPD